MFMYAVKKPAVAAAAALGEDGTAVFCEGPGLLFASARGEAPDAGITTAIFNVEKGDIHDGDRWFPGAGSIAEVVFDMPAPLGEKLAGRLEDSTFLIGIFRDEIASLSEECDVITGANIHVGPPAQLEMPAPHTETKASDEMKCRNILDIRDRTEGERGAQLVFVDSSTPASGRWNIQDDVRRRLIEAGVPESEIACVTDAKGKSKLKEALYEKVRSGDIRILLGSTTTLGTGTNVQTRLAAIHDLDCPW